MNRGTLVVHGSGPVSEVVVRDQDLRVVAAGAQSTETVLDEGIYRVDVWVPGMTDVRYAAVRGGEVVTHEVGGLVPDSVAPLAAIRTADERHSQLASSVASSPQLHRHLDAEHYEDESDAGRLFLFARSSGGPRFVAPRVQLHDLEGNELASLETDGHVDALGGCAGLAVDLRPGHYVLSHVVPKLGRRGQIVRVLPARETQVFAWWAEDHVDLASALICAPALGTGFSATSTGRYLRAELVLRSLWAGRRVGGRIVDDPLLEMVDAVARRMERRWSALRPPDEEERPDARGWTDLVLLSSAQAPFPSAIAGGGPPLLAASVSRLAEIASADVYPSTWPVGLLEAPVVGSVWARWDLDEAPLPAYVDRAAHIEMLGSDTDPGPPRGHAGSTVSRPRLKLQERAKAPGLAAAPTVVAGFDRGRHFDIAVWAPDDSADNPPRAQLGVRLGVTARLYSRGGEPVRYAGAVLPVSPMDAVVMSVRAGEPLLEHLARYIEFEAAR